MITRQVIQTCIDEMKELTKVDFCVIDIQGFLMASTFGKNTPDISMMKSFFESPADSQIIGGNYVIEYTTIVVITPDGKIAFNGEDF